MSEHEEDGLDLTSDPFESNGETSKQQQTGRPATPRKRDMLRVLFRCCNLYTSIPMPVEDAATLDPYWNAHCPRCGRTAVIPRDSGNWQ